MKKTILFLALIVAIFTACEQQVDKKPTTKPNIEPNIWINTDSECCGVKDPLNTLEWLRAKSQFDEDNESPNYQYNYIFLFRNNETQKEHIVVNRYSRVSWVSIYDCEGNYIDGGHYSIQNQTKFISSKLKNDPPEPCDTCYEFFKTHTLVDTIAYSMVKS